MHKSSSRSHSRTPAPRHIAGSISLTLGCSPAHQRRPIRIASTPTWRSPCMTRQLQRGNRSTITTDRAQANWTTDCKPHCRFLVARPIHLSMPQRLRRRPLSSLIFCRPKHSRFKIWLNRRDGLVLAGLQYPSDYNAGLDLGRRVGEQVIAQAMTDGSDAVWTGSMPTGPCIWVGTNPGNVTAANWRPLLLTSPSQFRPAPPPTCDSPQMVAETAEVRNFPRAAPGAPASFVFRYKAFYWQSPEGLNTWPYRYADSGSPKIGSIKIRPAPRAHTH